MHEIARHGEVAVALRRMLDVDILGRQLSATLRCHVALATTEIKGITTLIRNRGAQAYILDANYPRESLLEAARARDSVGKQALLMLGDYYNPQHAQMAESMSAAYCSRDVALPELVGIVGRLLGNGEEAPSTANGLIQAGRRHRIDHPLAEELSDRELEVMLLLSEGRSVKECAEVMKLAESTIENHKFRLMRKLGVHRFTDVMRMAIRAGLISA